MSTTYPYNHARYADWSTSSNPTRCLQPTPWGIGRFLLALLLTDAACLSLAIDSHDPASRAKGCLTSIVFGMLTAVFLYRIVTGQLTLNITRTGFRIGKHFYAWSNAGAGFTRGDALGVTVSFTNAGKRTTIPNFYAMSSTELADLLNSYQPRHRSRPSGASAQANAAAPAAARRKPLPPWAWIAITAVFILIMQCLGPVTNGLWSTFAPVSYAAHTLDDYTLTNHAGQNPALLPALIARARGGDRAAYFYLGDLYDPTDFLCETAVPKNPAAAASWYQRGAALDDQGAERALGYFYLKGIGVPQSNKRAAALFERAVSHNDGLAEYYLGQMLEIGLGEPIDLLRATALETASAAQGNELGQEELGMMYLLGLGVSENRAKAQTELDLAAAQGNVDARNLLTQNGMP